MRAMHTVSKHQLASISQQHLSYCKGPLTLSASKPLDYPARYEARVRSGTTAGSSTSEGHGRRDGRPSALASERCAPPRAAGPNRLAGRRGLTAAHVRAPLAAGGRSGSAGRVREAPGGRRRCGRIAAQRRQCHGDAATPCSRLFAGSAAIASARARSGVVARGGAIRPAGGHIAHSSLSSLQFRAVGRAKRRLRTLDVDLAAACAPWHGSPAAADGWLHTSRHHDVIARHHHGALCAQPSRSCAPSPAPRPRPAPAERHPRLPASLAGAPRA
ncbi:uncharacterized protein CC84DRAFT_1174956 [Paraphaeosphaeria sporulosa]|uniref:Uncharacterized protein n=1 Tax=Paraphaeosphaeria sporulosa TaxID=1460663 RepID=A0A177CIF1_9PLEO|nr:uncharacterized protein CC84DRAFT_1174956 [Paraphaeosphaeria sporulosa]OAG07086.1 hypothetical protein CC84DRAFT_1174956 [Paraphaeosphaeria sporulosa]